jgi:hypothetical protein
MEGIVIVGIKAPRIWFFGTPACFWVQIYTKLNMNIITKDVWDETVAGFLDGFFLYISLSEHLEALIFWTSVARGYIDV